jgi:hypothetical protein
MATTSIKLGSMDLAAPAMAADVVPAQECINLKLENNVLIPVRDTKPLISGLLSIHTAEYGILALSHVFIHSTTHAVILCLFGNNCMIYCRVKEDLSGIYINDDNAQATPDAFPLTTNDISAIAFGNFLIVSNENNEQRIFMWDSVSKYEECKYASTSLSITTIKTAVSDTSMQTASQLMFDNGSSSGYSSTYL